MPPQEAGEMGFLEQNVASISELAGLWYGFGHDCLLRAGLRGVLFRASITQFPLTYVQVLVFASPM